MRSTVMSTIFALSFLASTSFAAAPNFFCWADYDLMTDQGSKNTSNAKPKNMEADKPTILELEGFRFEGTLEEIRASNGMRSGKYTLQMVVTKGTSEARTSRLIPEDTRLTLVVDKNRFNAGCAPKN